MLKAFGRKGEAMRHLLVYLFGALLLVGTLSAVTPAGSAEISEIFDALSNKESMIEYVEGVGICFDGVGRNRHLKPKDIQGIHLYRRGSRLIVESDPCLYQVYFDSKHMSESFHDVLTNSLIELKLKHDDTFDEPVCLVPMKESDEFILCPAQILEIDLHIKDIDQ